MHDPDRGHLRARRSISLSPTELLHTAAPSRRLPTGLLPLVVAVVVLIAVPIARAAGAAPAATVGDAAANAGGAPISEATRKPQVSARLINSRSTGGAAIRVRVRLKGTGHGKAHVRLAVRPSGARRWRTVTTKNTKADKSFTMAWRGARPGRYMTRVSVRKFGHTDIDRTGRAFIFRRSFASYYGPGLYGGALACGGRLTPGTVGVAHKTLPCGTRVAFKVGRRVVTARVIDRGPYVGGRDWDLTAALKQRLRFGSTGFVYTTR